MRDEALDRRRSRRSLVAFGGLVALVCAVAAIDPITARLKAKEVQGGAYEPLQVFSSALPLYPDDPTTEDVGTLVYRGGLKLASPDPRFGGLSGMIVSPDGRRLLALSDRGVFVLLDLAYEAGRLSGATGEAIAPMLNAEGVALTAPRYDAESLVAPCPWPLKDGASAGCDVLVGFETADRVERYPLGEKGLEARPVPFPMPTALAKAARNKGLEGLAMIDGGRLLAITERTLDSDGNIIGWIVPEGGASEGDAVTLVRDDPFDLTDLAVMANGDVVTLERRFSRIGGPGMQMRRLAAASLTGGARLDGETLAELDVSASIDNMEALFVRQDTEGRTLFYVLSDDNQSDTQRTVLLMFELRAAARE